MLMLILKLNHRKKCIQFLTFLLLFSLLISVGAACLRPHIVYASVAGTIAGYILTLFASFNTAITNPEVVTAINNAFGQMSMVEADAALIDQGIASIAASTGFDMASIFATTADEAAQVIAAANLTGVEAAAATAGVNIAAGAGACAASTTGSVLPVIGGIVLPAAGAVALGVAGGFLIAHITNKFKGYFEHGFPLNTSQQKINIVGNNGVVNCSGSNYYGYFVYSPSHCIVVKYPDGSGKYKALIGSYQGTVDGFQRWYNASNNQMSTGGSLYLYKYPYWMNVLENPALEDWDTPYSANSYNDAQSFINNFNSNKIVYPESPDVIGLEGNQRGENYDNQFVIPNIYPIYNYGDTIINYINPTDYNTFIQNANQNTDNGLTGEDTQGNYFDNFVTPYIQSIEQNPENPNPDIPNPEQKPTVPYPDPEEFPDAIPEVNPIPDNDIAPTSIPYPELPEPTDNEITETNDKITPFDLKNKFPFCLPFDIHKSLLKLKGAREAPYFVWQIPFGDAGQQTITIDLRAWDEVASILRLLELLLFIVGLAVATRNLIGGT